ncbi:transposase [Corynebacterium glyciniphilum]|uniref:transposase n=1 Tax=Corynebacterium glyciniphilum TaxID=1404244 RepID=UPI003D9FEDE8
MRPHAGAVLASIGHGLSNGRIESAITKIRLLARVAFGFRSPELLMALVHLGDYQPELPVRAGIHRCVRSATCCVCAPGSAGRQSMHCCRQVCGAWKFRTLPSARSDINVSTDRALALRSTSRRGVAHAVGREETMTSASPWVVPASPGAGRRLCTSRGPSAGGGSVPGKRSNLGDAWCGSVGERILRRAGMRSAS